MLVNSVIIILREFLEAALIISILLALSQKLQLSKNWIVIALVLGAVGATIYAFNIQSISLALEGAGQEVLNASIHLLLAISIALFVVVMRNKQSHTLLLFIITSVVVLAITREVSEIIIYIHGLITIPDFVYPVLIGSIIGAGIGMSVGVFFYYLIANLSFNKGLKLGLILLVLIAGSMILQATRLLIQVDIIAGQQALWDSSFLISEHSLTGELLYALIGYEATPTPIQFGAYICSLVVMTFLTIRTLNHFKQREAG